MTEPQANPAVELERRLRSLSTEDTLSAWHQGLHTLTLLARESFAGRFAGAPIDNGRNVCEAIHRVSSFLMTARKGIPDTTSVDLLRWIEHRLQPHLDIREAFATTLATHVDGVAPT